MYFHTHHNSMRLWGTRYYPILQSQGSNSPKVTCPLKLEPVFEPWVPDTWQGWHLERGPEDRGWERRQDTPAAGGILECFPVWLSTRAVAWHASLCCEPSSAYAKRRCWICANRAVPKPAPTRGLRKWHTWAAEQIVGPISMIISQDRGLQMADQQPLWGPGVLGWRVASRLTQTQQCGAVDNSASAVARAHILLWS